MSETNVEAPGYTTELRESDLTVTASARVKLKELLNDIQKDESGIEAVRIYVTGGGCSGMDYGMTFTEDQTSFDRVLDEDGLRLYIDAVALSFLNGTEIDYDDSGFDASFVFRNAFQAIGGSGGCNACGAASGGGCA